MLGPRTRRILTIIGVIFVALVVLVALAVVGLRLTNPSPEASPPWERLADMPQARGEVAAAVVDGRLVVAGGLTGIGSTSDAVAVYDIERDTWTAGDPLPHGLHHAAAAALDGHIYVSGGARGATDWEPATGLWRAEPGGAWEELEPMPEGRQGHAMVAHDGRLYVVGGVGTTDDVLIYDAGRWTRGAGMANGRDHLRAVVWNDEVWALGGRNGTPSDAVDIYDPSEDRWRAGPALPEPMSAMAVGVVDDTLHVLGGEDPSLFGGGVTATHVAIRDGDVRWDEREPAILAVHGAGSGTYDGRLIVAGGASRQGALSVLSWTDVVQAY